MRKFLKTILKGFQFLVGASFAILLVLAIAGAFVALFGGLTGLENVKEVGKTMSGTGAFGFLFGLFVLVASGFGEILFLSSSVAHPAAQPAVNATIPSNVVAMGKKENVG